MPNDPNEPQYRKFYVEWWKIRQSTIIAIVAIFLVLGLIGYGGWRFLKSDFVNKPDAPQAPKDAAIVISFEGDVRIIRAATRETILVTRQTFVSAGDTIQTQADGRAKIQMIDGSVLSIRANSTVVIRDSNSLFGGPNVRVTLDDGQINVRTDEQPANTENVVEVRESENKIGADTDASFDINKDNNSGEIRISRGSIETTVGGEKTVVRENEFAALNEGKIATKEKLLGPPIHNSPSSDEQLVGSLSGIADVMMRWQSPDVNLALSYSIQISKLPQFASPDAIIVDKQGLTSPSLAVGGLLPGTYYWRVKASSSSGQSSNWSAYWKFTVIKRENSKAIGVRDWNVESLGGTIYRVSGKTQPGATVRSQGKSVFALGDGAFLLQISAPGAQVTVEVSDDRGNRSSFVIGLPSGKLIKQF
ncbi:MAG: FecR domain-containing protein [Acidobacteria bacterium]|nr:FecR domain-containing protein [Acidobacteriota bacterium]MBK8813914.1 FecR domain-containing protein [Acidobacteriota bacterium]